MYATYLWTALVPCRASLFGMATPQECRLSAYEYICFVPSYGKLTGNELLSQGLAKLWIVERLDFDSC